MIKLLLGVGITAVCGVLGLSYSKELRLRVKLLSQIVSMFGKIEIMIRYRKATVRNMIETIRSDSEFDLAAPVFDGIGSRTNALSLLSDEERQQLDAFVSSLGTTDEQGQLAVIKLYSTGFESSLKTALENERKYFKLYASLGLLGGLFITAMIF
ncbi:MAG: stage III sporulation protein AB [Ruminococcus sp.]|nr:stage III sporulation protein AB [Ruminococcus sp.]